MDKELVAMCKSTVGVSEYLKKTYNDKKETKESVIWIDIYGEEKLGESESIRKYPRVGPKYQAVIPELKKN